MSYRMLLHTAQQPYVAGLKTHLKDLGMQGLTSQRRIVPEEHAFLNGTGPISRRDVVHFGIEHQESRPRKLITPTRCLLTALSTRLGLVAHDQQPPITLVQKLIEVYKLASDALCSCAGLVRNGKMGGRSHICRIGTTDCNSGTICPRGDSSRPHALWKASTYNNSMAGGIHLFDFIQIESCNIYRRRIWRQYGLKPNH